MPSPITNVFVLMLENRSFDNVFAMSGIPGITAATTSNTNAYNGTDYAVQKGAPFRMTSDPGHEFLDVLAQLAGADATYTPGGNYPAIDNSGFAYSYATTATEGPPPSAGSIGDIMKCFDTPNQLPVIYQLATEFALCDMWFSSLPGPTWPNRFFVHGASSGGLDHSPSSQQIAQWEANPLGGFTYPNGSIFDALNQARIPWRIYHDDKGPLVGTAPQVTSIRGVSFLGLKPVSRLAKDLQKPYRFGYTFIEPSYGDITSGSYAGGSSQHPMDDITSGEALIKTVYEAIRNSPLWPNSLLIITYDEHGGFYDSVAPGRAHDPADDSFSSTLNQNGFTFTQYGVRVPAIVVSPLIEKGFVDHKVYDHASVPATVERVFGMPALTQRDENANDVLGLLTLQSARDCPATLHSPAKSPMLTKAAPSLAAQPLVAMKPVPNHGILTGVMGIMLKTELELSTGMPAEREAILANFNQIKTRGEAQTYIERITAKAKAATGT